MRALALSLILIIAAHAAWADECDGGAAGSVTVSATDLAFGTYDARQAGPDEATFTVTASCDGGTAGAVLPPLSVTLTAGDGSYAQRRMEKGTDGLNYQIFLDPGLSLVWGDGTGATSAASGGGATTADFTGYGAIPAGQWAAVGMYGDSVTVTVSY